MGEETASGGQEGGGREASHASVAEDLQRTTATATAIRSARSFRDSSSTRLHSLQYYIPQLKSQYKVYEDAFFKKLKDQLIGVREHPLEASGVAVAAGLLLMRGPRSFLYRNTVGWLQSEEAQYVRAQKKVKELCWSAHLIKEEGRKLLDMASFAEKQMERGHMALVDAGRQIQHIAKAANKAEAEAADLMEGLRQIPGRQALKLRAEVASMASFLKQRQADMDRRIRKISDLGIRV